MVTADGQILTDADLKAGRRTVAEKKQNADMFVWDYPEVYTRV